MGDLHHEWITGRPSLAPASFTALLADGCVPKVASAGGGSLLDRLSDENENDCHDTVESRGCGGLCSRACRCNADRLWDR